jgi:molybdopterin-guanine dinucleotide biosynthesis protein A
MFGGRGASPLRKNDLRGERAGWRSDEAMDSPAIKGYVMAGGASSRFGTDKALAQLGGRTMLARMCDLLREVTDSVGIVASSASYSGIDAQMVPDRWPGEGPLGGIVTALEQARSSEVRAARCLIVSCDMPFLTAEWLQYLCAHAANSAAQIVVPRSAQGLEPLCACWSIDAADTLHGLFDGGVRKVTEVFKHTRTEILDEAHWKRFDSADRLFWNMNTPRDYDDAARIFAQERQ